MLREERADPKYKVVNRQRYHFVSGDTPYSVDVYQNVAGRDKTYVLRFANPENKEPLSLVPDFIKVEMNVRSSPEFKLRSIAKIE